MTAKEHLQSIYSIKTRIERIDRERQELRDQMYSVGSPAGHMNDDKVQTSISGDQMLKLIARIDALERDIVSELQDLTEKRHAIIKEIERVPNENYKQLLFDRYILCQKWEQIALNRNTGVRWIYRMHGKALAAFEKVWNSH